MSGMRPDHHRPADKVHPYTLSHRQAEYRKRHAEPDRPKLPPQPIIGEGKIRVDFYGYPFYLPGSEGEYIPFGDVVRAMLADVPKQVRYKAKITINLEEDPD